MKYPELLADELASPLHLIRMCAAGRNVNELCQEARDACLVEPRGLSSHVRNLWVETRQLSLARNGEDISRGSNLYALPLVWLASSLSTSARSTAHLGGSRFREMTPRRWRSCTALALRCAPQARDERTQSRTASHFGNAGGRLR